MKIIDGKLYLTFQQMLECGFKENTLKDAKKRGAKCWSFIDDPQDNRKVLVEYDILSDDKKEKVKQRFGNVYDQVAREPILAMVVGDAKALEFFKAYRFGEGQYFPLYNTDKHTGGTVSKYVRAASWLNMLRDLDKQVVKKVLNISLAEFYMQVAELIAQERERGKIVGCVAAEVLPGDFPSTYQRLMGKLDQYKAEGYGALLNCRLENKHRSKLGKVLNVGGNVGVNAGELAENAALRQAQDDINGVIIAPKSANKRGAFDQGLHDTQVAVIRSLCALGQNLDAGQVANIAKMIFTQKGWEPLSRRTISRYIKENKNVLTAGRKGKRAYNNTVAMQVTRKAPSVPMVYVTLDGWTVELYYREYDSSKSKWDYKRLVMVVVLDPFNKYPLGYAVGTRETAELIKEACRNAIVHTKELFGEPYSPMQVQSDHYQIKNLTPFYQAMAGKYYTPAAVGNSKAKVIEPYFRHLNKSYCQLQKNWSGYNVDANRDNQVNREWLDMVKSTFPDRKGVEQQIDNMMAQERAGKVAAYLAGWEQLGEKDRCPLGVADYLMMFGVPLGERTSKIAGQGIIKQIAGETYVYDSFETAFRENMHLDWKLIGDPENLGRVLAVSPDEKLRFVLEAKRDVAMAIHDRTEEDVQVLKRIADYNSARVEEITNTYGQDADTMREVVLGLSEEQVKNVHHMFTHNGQQKEAIQDNKALDKAQKRLAAAVRKAQEQQEAAFSDEHMAFVTKGIDFDQYL